MIFPAADTATPRTTFGAGAGLGAEPSLGPDVLVHTPQGLVAAACLLAGDLVLTRAGTAQVRAKTVVLTAQGPRHRLHCDVPEVLQLDGAEALSAPLPAVGAATAAPRLLH